MCNVWSQKLVVCVKVSKFSFLQNGNEQKWTVPSCAKVGRGDHRLLYYDKISEMSWTRVWFSRRIFKSSIYSIVSSVPYILHSSSSSFSIHRKSTPHVHFANSLVGHRDNEVSNNTIHEALYSDHKFGHNRHRRAWSKNLRLYPSVGSVTLISNDFPTPLDSNFMHRLLHRLGQHQRRYIPLRQLHTSIAVMKPEDFAGFQHTTTQPCLLKCQRIHKKFML